MYVLNKIVGALLNPLALGLLLVLAAALCAGFRRVRAACVCAAVAFAWFWFWSTKTAFLMLGLPLETEFPVEKAEDAPVCDAIVLLGGGMGSNTNRLPYAEMWSGADRAWHAARLFRAGRAPLVIPSGRCEEESTVPLLLDFGVPRAAIAVEGAARNTEENAKFVERLLAARAGGEPARRPRVLLVTSAWHMRRSLLMYRMYAPGLDIVPAAADHEAIASWRSFQLDDLVPTADCLGRTCALFKEYVGYWGYRLLRRPRRMP